jgi:hypothetical protein
VRIAFAIRGRPSWVTIPHLPPATGATAAGLGEHRVDLFTTNAVMLIEHLGNLLDRGPLNPDNLVGAGAWALAGP